MQTTDEASMYHAVVSIAMPDKLAAGRGVGEPNEFTGVMNASSAQDKK